MKRWLANLALVLYLSAFAGGLIIHAFRLPATYNPAIYFFVWDMYCGWSNYERRTHVVAEGDSGKYYELSPAPWGELRPFGNIGRTHYDASGAYALKSGLNTLKHTDHEPIARVFVIEEYYSKKYNLRDELWSHYYDEPKKPTYYRNVVLTVMGDGTPIEVRNSWLAEQHTRTLTTNPRVMAESHRAKPFVALDRSAMMPVALPFLDPSFNAPLAQ